MIPKAYITEWTAIAPWKSNEQVEQDLVISRALVAIFAADFLANELAFRGGTALHKLYLSPPPRYSEDIDLVQVNEGNIGEILDGIRKVLNPWFELKAKYKKTAISHKLIYRFQAEFAPNPNMRLKIEINTREHFSELDLVKFPFKMNSKWFTGDCKITTYHLEELLGTKLRALYQRSKGRDLFDLYQAFNKKTDIDLPKVIACYRTYMQASGVDLPTKEQYIKNIETKMQDSEFTGDTIGLIKPNEEWNSQAAFHFIKMEILDKL